MTWSDDALKLRSPNLVALPRSGDRLSFLYLDRVKVWQDETGVVAMNDRGEHLRIPVASLSTLMLGPGCSITTPAVVTVHRAGCSILTTSDGGITVLTAGRALTGRAKWAEAQARLWTDHRLRVAAARSLYERRFPSVAWDDLPLKRMRGLEGRQMKLLYSRYSTAAGLPRWRRDTRGEDQPNQLLNLANSILYGSAAAAVHALGLHPGLGIVHQGAVGALLFDLADNHKARSSLPLAFEHSVAQDPARSLRTAMRHYLHREKVLDDHLLVLDEVFGPHVRPASADDTLLDDENALVAGHVNYSADADLNHPGG